MSRIAIVNPFTSELQLVESLSNVEGINFKPINSLSETPGLYFKDLNGDVIAHFYWEASDLAAASQDVDFILKKNGRRSSNDCY